MNLAKYFIALALLALLSACGGGGGNPGTSSAGSAGVAALPLFTSAPASLSLTSGSTSPSYSISGGVAPYTVTSDRPSLMSVPLSGAEFSISLAAGASGSGSITITDAKGAKLSITVTVPAPAAMFTTAPASLSLVSGATSPAYTISGGVAPYTVGADTPSLMSVSLSGSTFTVSAVAGKNGSGVVNVSDSAGTKLSVTVTVPAPTAMFTTAPASLSLVSGATSPAYTISGGVAPYTVGADTPSLMSVSLSGSTFTVSAVAGKSGSGVVNVSDSAGTKLSVTVTVPAPATLFVDVPANLTVPIDATGYTYTVSGGTGPYTAVSSNTAVVSSTTPAANGRFVIQGVSVGSAAITIKDAMGVTITITVTVPSATALFSTAPATLQILSGTTNFYTVFGGTAPYVVNSNGVIAKAVLSGASLAISGMVPGLQTVAISDAKGAVITIDVTVKQGLYTDAPSSLSVVNGTGATYSIFGGIAYSGTAAYRVNSSNPAVATATVSGSTIAISGLSAGSTSFVISDAVGATITIVVTVPAAGALISTAPSPLTLPMGASGSGYALSGGVGPYTATSANPALVSASVTPVGSSILVITALPTTAGGQTNVVVTDSKGVTLTIVVNVPAPVALSTTAPSPLSIGKATSPYTYVILGGYPPYMVSSSVPSIVSASVSGSTLSISALNAGSANVVVTDSQGKVVTIDVRVRSSNTLFSNAPASSVASPIVMSVGSSYAYVVSGGSVIENGGAASYSANSTNPGVVSASFAGPVLTVTGLANGASTVRITDAVGATLDLSFSVGSGSSGAASTYPTLTPVLQTSAVPPVSTSLIDATSYTLLKVTLKDPSGAGIPNQVISVSGDATKLSFPEGNAALTDASGIATIKVARASLNATGAGVMTVTYDYKPGMIASYSGGVTPPAVGNMVTTYAGYQLVTANITLTSLDVGTPATMSAYATRLISVIANINGLPATTTPVTVTFTATCGQLNPGQVIPVTATTDSTGKATVTYSATDVTGTSPSTLGCSGKTVQITASTTGAAALSQGLTVTAAPATSMSFVSAAPARIYLASACGVSPSSANPTCATQSTLTFQLLNQSGEGIPGQSVLLTLKSLTGGTPKAAFDTLGSIVPVTLTTDSSGKVSQPVYSGSVPTNVIINAKLVTTPTIQTDSSVLAIASGRPVQSRLSIALEKFAIEGFSVDGTTTNVTLNLADRNGNPVPDGTGVNFVTAAGVMIPPTCVTGTVAGNSTCTVSIRSQGARPASGLVTILAYAAGEEDFTDSNGNNVYDCGEPFSDLGIAYRSDTMISSVVNPYVAGEFTVPRAAEASNCGVSVTPTASTGDGVWGAADVRRQAVIVFATGAAIITNPAPITSFSLSFTVADGNGNSMPTGTNIVVSAGDNTPANSITCSVFSGANTVVPNTLNPLTLSASFLNCATGDLITVAVTSPLGVATQNTYTIP